MSEAMIKTEYAKLERFEKAVEVARALLESINNKQMKIAELALSVCTKRKNKWEPLEEGTLSIKHFAEAIGVNHRTLLEWICIYEQGAVALNPEAPSEVPIKEAKKVLVDNRLSKKHNVKDTYNTRRIRRNAAKNKSEKAIGSYAEIYLRYTNRFFGQLENQKISSIPQGVKAELKIKLTQILKRL